MEPLNKKIHELLQGSESFAVATIITSSGSTPRTSGSKMAILKDGTIYGTIGGGIVEAMVIKNALELIGSGRARVVEFTLDRELTRGLDMVCGGSLTIMVESLSPDENLRSIFLNVVESEKIGEKRFVVSRLEGERSDFRAEKFLVGEEGKIVAGTGSMLPQSLIDRMKEGGFSGSAAVICSYGNEELVVDPVPVREKLFIFGAGHVGFQLAKIAHIIDFRTFIIDDREDFANRERFPDAEEIHVAESYEDAFKNLSIDKLSYLVILTRGHLHDQTVLEAALKKDPAYIGMIGSRTKRDTIYANLKQKGVSRERLESVYSPVGLNIRSETPAEIAVSIIGQIIQVRATGK